MQDDTGDSPSTIYQRKCAQALQHLQGIVDGMMSDGRLDPREVQFLNAWLTAHPEATADWPGSLLHRKVRQILADGLMSSSELSYLHEALSHLASAVFDDAPAALPETAPLPPVDDAVAVDVRDARICLAGAFLFGTRASCERLVRSAGGILSDRVSTRVDFLVIGTRGSPAWHSEPYREDIDEAVALRRLGHRISIISERRLLESLR